MRFWRKRPRETTHTGIELRISLRSKGPVVEADSDRLHWIARYGGISDPCRPDCPPGCQDHGWYNLLSGLWLEALGTPGPEVLVEIRPVRLPNWMPLG